MSSDISSADLENWDEEFSDDSSEYSDKELEDTLNEFIEKSVHPNGSGSATGNGSVSGENEVEQPERPSIIECPDVRKLIVSLKNHVLSGVYLVFSSIIPLGVDAERYAKCAYLVMTI